HGPRHRGRHPHYQGEQYDGDESAAPSPPRQGTTDPHRQRRRHAEHGTACGVPDMQKSRRLRRPWYAPPGYPRPVTAPDLTLTACLRPAALDARRGIVRLHPEVLRALGLKPGDAVRLTGRRTTA